MTAKYANHAKKEADWGFPSRTWRISRLNLLAAVKTYPICGCGNNEWHESHEWAGKNRQERFVSLVQFVVQRPPGGGRRPPWRNKANSSIADWRLPRFARNDMSRIGDKPVAAPVGFRRGQLYKQTQFPPLCRSGDRRSQGANCAKRTQIFDCGLEIAALRSQ